VRGRPPIAPRVQELEKRVHELSEFMAALAKENLQLMARCKALETQQAPKAYEPRFDHWPSLR
jgi:hypothetical protein